jgi:transposase
MKRCPKLDVKQKQELERFIKEATDSKEIRRSQSVLLVDRDVDYGAIHSLTGFKERSVLIFRQRYLKHGLKGLEHRRKGKPKALLTKAQREEIITLLTTTSPQDHGYESGFWSTAILGDLIQVKYQVAYKTKKPFYLLFEDAKFSFHKPGQVYEKRDEAKVVAWQEEIRPKLAKAFADPHTVILCEDEMVLSSTTTFQKIWLRKGEYPKIEVSNTKKNKSIYGFLNLKEGKEHSFVKDWQNMQITVEVLQEIRLIYPHVTILLLWDGAGWHRGSKVQEFIKADGGIEAIYFPPYSPEENPQEHVWKAGRSAVTHNTFIADIAKTASEFVGYLNGHNFSYSLCGFTARS